MGDLKRAHDASDSSPSSKVAKKAGGGDVSASKAQNAAASLPPKRQDTEGNSYWELSKMRRVTISHFRNSTLINIREFYDAAGQMRPGKKGISLSVDQYKALVQAIPAINAELRNDGVDIAEDVDEGTPAVAAASKSNAKAEKAERKTKKAPKSNIEMTSDEDEDD